MSDLPKIDYASATSPQIRRAEAFGGASCVISVLAIVYPLGEIWSCYSIPPAGTAVRFDWTSDHMTFCSAIGLLLALPLACACMKRGRHRRSVRLLACFALAASVFCIVGDYTLFMMVVHTHRLVLVP